MRTYTRSRRTRHGHRRLRRCGIIRTGGSCIEDVWKMTEKTIQELALDAIDQALAESIRQQFIHMALTDPVDDGGIPLALRRFKRWLPVLADLHKQARMVVAGVFE